MESLSETLKRVAEHRARFSKPRRILLEQCCATLHGSAEVLELGAGDGQLFEDLPAALRDRFIALEPDPGCVKSLSRTYREVLQGRAEAIPAGDKRFSGAFGCCFLDVLDDPVAALEEMRRVLEPGAPFVHVLDMSTDLHGFFEALVDDGSS
ncbi:MAG: class I SAM-dependent methyltransferase, partial [Myxococcota bacterium]